MDHSKGIGSWLEARAKQMPVRYRTGYPVAGAEELTFRNESPKLNSRSRKTVPLQEDIVPTSNEMRPMDEQAALHEAIEKLYITFAQYPLRHPVQGCPHCVFKDDQERVVFRYSVDTRANAHQKLVR